ncbi:voltage-dependent p/q type calcium channel [Corchorus olitorius]|uniref:Voltage-dependent p/q type calcium channel n=1 Tax=Corchorus olitorius TaxID=93759 RepID=A0A1R3H3D8_9ROSI|nr:voltage-dependent p/q type calcium channel [Corchorus olitorius]
MASVSHTHKMHISDPNGSHPLGEGAPEDQGEANSMAKLGRKASQKNTQATVIWHRDLY